MKLKGTKKNKIAKNRSRKQKVTKTKQAKQTKTSLQKSKTKRTKNMRIGKGVEMFSKIMNRTLNEKDIYKIQDFTHLRELTPGFVIGFELEFPIGCCIYNNSTRKYEPIGKFDRIPFIHSDTEDMNIFLSGDIAPHNELLPKIEEFLNLETIYAVELICLPKNPRDDYKMDIVFMYETIYNRILNGEIILYSENFIGIDIGPISDTQRVIFFVEIPEEDDVETGDVVIIDVLKSIIQCTIDIRLEDIHKILDICIVLLLQDDDDTDMILSDQNKIKMLQWCRSKYPGDQYFGFLLCYLVFIMCYDIKESTKEKELFDRLKEIEDSLNDEENYYTDEDAEELYNEMQEIKTKLINLDKGYIKSYFPFVLRENFKDIIDVLRVGELNGLKDMVKNSLMNLIPEIIQFLKGLDLILDDNIIKMQKSESEYIYPPISLIFTDNAITSIYASYIRSKISFILDDDFCEKIGVQHIPINIGGVSSLKVENRGFDRDKNSLKDATELYSSIPIVIDMGILYTSRMNKPISRLVTDVLELDSFKDIIEKNDLISDVIKHTYYKREVEER